MGRIVRTSALLLTLCLFAVACGSTDGGDSSDAGDSITNSDDAVADVAELRVLSATESAEIISNASPDLVVLDVRTADEFAEGHIEGADMLDFYRADFADELAKLPRDAEYVIYCRSGNRSGQTLELMRELGFADVVDIDGGIIDWTASELPVTVP